MKKLHYFAMFLIVFGLNISCSSDSDDDMPPAVVTTYTNTVKNIISGNCNSCHGNPTTNSAPMSLTTYDEVKNSVQTRNLIGLIENGSMPPNGNLTPSQITAIKNWQSGGFIE